MFLSSIFVSSPAFLAIALVLFNFAVAFVYALHLIMPKQARGFAVWEELIVPPLDIENADKKVLVKRKRKTVAKRKKKR